MNIKVLAFAVFALSFAISLTVLTVNDNGERVREQTRLLIKHLDDLPHSYRVIQVPYGYRVVEKESVR